MRTRILACLALLAPLVAAPAPALAQTTDASPRKVMALADGWRFHFGDLGDAPAQVEFDDGGWETVSVPHSWNRIGEYRLERTEATDDRQGPGWYRLRVAAPPAEAGRRQYLDFAAVGAVADVFVNGAPVGGHRGAFSRFRLDVTDAWRPGETNLIAVRADNSKPAPGSPTQDVLPLSGDFFVHGGIYRPVALVTAGEAGIDLLDHGGPGIYAKSVSVTPDAAEVETLARLRNAGAQARALELVATIRDATGAEVATRKQPVTLPPGPSEARIGLRLPRPHLWDGRSDPYLYSLAVELREVGRAIDRVVQPLGVRTFDFDPDKGLFLNGKPIKLRGAARHQDRLGKGWALSARDHAEDMGFFVEIGANAVRQAHYQHADDWSDLADRAGMVVWAEVPYVNTPSLLGGKGSDALWANAEAQATELVRQNFNHPSILMWSVGNEIDMAGAPGPNCEAPRPLPLLQRLEQVVKHEDPSRPTVFADCCESAATPPRDTFAGTADLVGYNRYFGWYSGDASDAAQRLGAELDRLHARHPTLPMAVSEYGAGGAITQHTDAAKDVRPAYTGRPQPEEYESLLHERLWPVIRDRDYLFGGFVWTMFDFGVPGRNEGDASGLNTKGLVTADRKTRKEAFYFYKADWNPEPMIHLTEKRFGEREAAAITVTAYSNAKRASLSLNGRTVGEAPCPDRVCRWRNVALDPGPNEAVATARVGGVEVTDRATWTRR